MREINLIVVHCSATKPNQKVTVETIRRWHRERGWRDIGYHYVIDRKGVIYAGRPESEVGAHVAGHNARSLGVCYIGGLDDEGKPADTRTDAQKRALLELLKRLKGKYPKAMVCGHNLFAEKACPCFDAQKEYNDL